jgi:signal transduction histidine kinase
MRFKTMATVTATIFIATGMAFIFKGWDLVSAYGGPEVPIANKFRVVWMFRVMPFASLYGIAILGGGLLTLAVRNLRETASQTNVSLALFGMNALAGAIALTAWISIWRSKLGLITVAVFFAQAIGYCRLLVARTKNSSAVIKTASEPSAETLREKWAQQIHEAAAQQERNRLARDLHDSIKQQLFSINVNAATVQARWVSDEAGARVALEAVRGGVREAMAEMEAMLHSLRPAPLETVGLIEALRQQCDSLQYRTGAQVTAEIGELPADQEFPVGAQDAIFRVAQEALANIARHARAQNVRLRLHWQTRDDEDVVWLKIEDDGNGFDTAYVRAGMGLANIRSRVLEIGGSMQLESSEGEGTSLTVRIPLAKTETGEIRRELRISLVFAIVGFFAGVFATYYGSKGPWPIIGGPFFALSAIGCQRAGKAIKTLKASEATTTKKIWELEIYWRQVRAVFYAVTVWSAIYFLYSALSWLPIVPQMAEFALPALWLILQSYELWRAHQIIRLQRKLSTPREFHHNIRRVWSQGVWAILLAAPFLSLTLYYGREAGVIMPFGIALLLCWLLPTCWLVWDKMRLVKVS